MLHTLRHSPWHCDMAGLLRMLQEGDDLLLLQDAVIAALSGSYYLELLLAAPISVYVLKEDLVARGLAGQISNCISCIDYTEFVRLTVKQPTQMSW